MQGAKRKQGLSGALDKFLLRFAAISLALLFASQALLLNPSIRRMVSLVDRLEGEPLAVARRIDPEPKPPLPRLAGTFTIQLENSTGRTAVLLLNGEEVATFEKGIVTVEVRSGDLVEVDGGLFAREMRFRVTQASKGMVAPFSGQLLTTKGTIEILARVKIQ
ncbi:MAG: hypothetical protein Q8P50_08285 [Bacillota bacterium]|nr:hypothetical protein [Bacillota bacterium]